MPSLQSGPGILRGLVALVSLLFPTTGQSQHSVEPAFPDLQFTRPVDLQHAGDSSDRLFVVEQAGRIQVFNNEPAVSSKKTFLDIRDRVNDSGNEEGLLGLAFHPQYAQNGLFYVYYSARGGNRCSGTSGDRCSKVSRFSVSSSDPDAADVDTESVILEVGQPFDNHNGGQIRFGPDGFLYVA
ncbi:MAG: sorbosone dehydrogenase family protein, partial [Rhodothermia bacterium]